MRASEAANHYKSFVFTLKIVLRNYQNQNVHASTFFSQKCFIIAILEHIEICSLTNSIFVKSEVTARKTPRRQFLIQAKAQLYFTIESSLFLSFANKLFFSQQTINFK